MLANTRGRSVARVWVPAAAAPQLLQFLAVELTNLTLKLFFIKTFRHLFPLNFSAIFIQGISDTCYNFFLIRIKDHIHMRNFAPSPYLRNTKVDPEL